MAINVAGVVQSDKKILAYLEWKTAAGKSWRTMHFNQI